MIKDLKIELEDIAKKTDFKSLDDAWDKYRDKIKWP
jgi:hypothetical protein